MEGEIKPWQHEEKPKKKRKNYRPVVWILLVIVLLQSALLFYQTTLPITEQHEMRQQQTQPARETQKPRSNISLEGYTEVTINTIHNTITMTDSCLQARVQTTDFQAYSISNGLQDKVEFRPTAHDLIADVFDSFSVEVAHARIEALDQGTYYATLSIKRDNKILTIDSKPSDAIAIAVRTNAPVFIKDSLFEEIGKDIC